MQLYDLKDNKLTNVDSLLFKFEKEIQTIVESNTEYYLIYNLFVQNSRLVILDLIQFALIMNQIHLQSLNIKKIIHSQSLTKVSRICQQCLKKNLI